MGDRGRGVRAAVSEYRNAGVSLVELTIYPGVRHEILNEPIKEKVMSDVVDFLSRQGL